MVNATLGFLLREHEVLLAMKKRGFGASKWNGFGGKLHEGERAVDSLIREAKEEIGVCLKPEHTKNMGSLTFYFLDRPEWDTFCTIFTVCAWEGEPRESEEMAPRWFSRDAIPFSTMWIDDPYWLPQVLAGKQLEAVFHFENNGARIATQEVRIL